MPHPVALTAGAAALGGALLLFSIVRLLALLNDSVVATLPVVAGQDVEFPQAGDFVLHVEQPRLDTPLDRAVFSLRDAAGHELASSPSLFRTTRSGLVVARISVRNFKVERPGRYHLTVDHLPVGRDLSRCALIFTRPFGLALMLWILGILLGAGGLLGGTILSILLIAGKLR
ncbi:MAG: hypothetical protein JWR07_612 [Nevskia sp.]|nr:hypothetical protein [Nevskia sp.]